MSEHPDDIKEDRGRQGSAELGQQLELGVGAQGDMGTAYQFERLWGVAALVNERAEEEDGEVIRWRGERAEDKG